MKEIAVIKKSWLYPHDFEYEVNKYFKFGYELDDFKIFQPNNSLEIFYIAVMIRIREDDSESSTAELCTASISNSTKNK